MNKLLILLFISLFLFNLNFISALDTDCPSHKINTNFELVISSNNATSCNFTYILNPDGTKSLTNYLMTKSGQTFNYTISSGYFNQQGIFYFGATCFDGVQYESGSVCRNVTTTGVASTSIFYFIFILIICLIFIAGYKLENNWIMWLGSILVLLLGFFVVINGIDVIKDTRTTWGIGIVLWALGVYFLFLCAETSLKEFR